MIGSTDLLDRVKVKTLHRILPVMLREVRLPHVHALLDRHARPQSVASITAYTREPRTLLHLLLIIVHRQRTNVSPPRPPRPPRALGAPRPPRPPRPPRAPRAPRARQRRMNHRLPGSRRVGFPGGPAGIRPPRRRYIVRLVQRPDGGDAGAVGTRRTLSVVVTTVVTTVVTDASATIECMQGGAHVLRVLREGECVGQYEALRRVREGLPKVMEVVPMVVPEPHTHSERIVIHHHSRFSAPPGVTVRHDVFVVRLPKLVD